MRVLIAGCGYVGCELGRRLAASGDVVFGLRRDARGLPAGVDPIEADLLAPASLRSLPGVDAVAITIAAAGSGEAAYREAYLHAVGHLLARLRAMSRPPRRVVFTSSTGVYGQTDGGWVDEASETAPTHYSGRIMLEAEAQLHESGLPVTCLRLGGIYGPGRDRMLRLAREGRAVIAPGGPYYANRMHRDDCAGALQHLLQLSEAAPLYIGCDSDPAEMAVICRWLAEQLGASPPAIAEHGRDAALQRRTNKRCSNKKLLLSGYRLRFPSFREGYRSLMVPS